MCLARMVRITKFCDPDRLTDHPIDKIDDPDRITDHSVDKIDDPDQLTDHSVDKSMIRIGSRIIASTNFDPDRIVDRGSRITVGEPGLHQAHKRSPEYH